MTGKFTDKFTGKFDVLVIGAGPAGVLAALRAGDLGARTGLKTDYFKLY